VRISSNGIPFLMNLLTMSTDPYYFGQVSQFARTYIAAEIRYIREQFRNSQSRFRDSVLQGLLEIENEIPNMKYSFED
jgi:hypothetical protein